MWVEFVVEVLVFAPRGFSPGTPVFLHPQETNISKFQFDLDTVDEEPPCGLLIPIYHLLFIYFLIPI